MVRKCLECDVPVITRSNNAQQSLRCWRHQWLRRVALNLIRVRRYQQKKKKTP